MIKKKLNVNYDPLGDLSHIRDMLQMLEMSSVSVPSKILKCLVSMTKFSSAPFFLETCFISKFFSHIILDFLGHLFL